MMDDVPISEENGALLGRKVISTKILSMMRRFVAMVLASSMWTFTTKNNP